VIAPPRPSGGGGCRPCTICWRTCPTSSARLGPADCAVLAQVGHPWLAAVLAATMPRAGKGGAAPLMLPEFVGSVAKANGCPWVALTCRYVAMGGRVEVLQWAREHKCPWDSGTCARVAMGGHLEVLKFARQHDCEWDWQTSSAAEGGHIVVLQWAREHGCPWTEDACAAAAHGGHLETLQWLREHHCPWNTLTCSCRR